MRATRKEMRDLARQVYKLEFDESSGKYYYANVKTGEATWSKPLIMGSEDIEFDYGSNTLKGRHADPGGAGLRSERGAGRVPPRSSAVGFQPSVSLAPGLGPDFFSSATKA